MMEMLLEMLETMGEDVDYVVLNDATVNITVNDFEGFDENWNEIEREYNAETVETLINWLDTHCVSTKNDFYSYYEFEEFSVVLGYASYDI